VAYSRLHIRSVGAAFNQDKKMTSYDKQKEYVIMLTALEIYVSQLAEEYDNKQTKYKLKRLEEAQEVLKHFKKIGALKDAKPTSDET
jgi:hypothetical protein